MSYHRMPSGKIPAIDGKPVLITQAQFENCCCLEPVMTKTCSGPGDGDAGEWEWTDPNDHSAGVEIWYTILGENHVGHVDYGVDTVLGPMNCPYGQEFCTDATWNVTWSPVS